MIGPRSTEQRRQDALYRLGHDVDAWVATTDTATGAPRLTPLSFLWHDDALIFSTSAPARPAQPRDEPVGAGRHRADPRRRAGAGDGRGAADVPDALGDAFAAKAGFEPRSLRDPYPYFRLTPRTIQAWREEDELAGRWIMRDGAWCSRDAYALTRGLPVAAERDVALGHAALADEVPARAAAIVDSPTANAYGVPGASRAPGAGPARSRRRPADTQCTVIPAGASTS